MFYHQSITNRTDVSCSDVLGKQPGVDLYIYDRSNQDAFLGHVTVFPNFSEDNSNLEGWFKLEARSADEDTVTGEIHLKLHFQKTDKKQFGPEDFEILKLIGKGKSADSEARLPCRSDLIRRYFRSGLPG